MRLHGTIGLGLVAAALFTAAPAQAASSVIAQWRFDEPSGPTAIDDGPFRLDGTLGALPGRAAPARVVGASGGALAFDGSSLVRLPNSAALEPQQLTVEAVVRSSKGPGGFRYVVAHGADGCIASSYALYTGRDGGIAFYVFDGSAYRISATAAPSDVWDGRWHHVAGVYDGASVRLYLDGHPVGSPEIAPARISYALASELGLIGAYGGSCDESFAGDVDLVRIWNGPLSPAFVAQLADAALTSPVVTSPPLAPPGGSDANAPATRATVRAIAPGRTVAATSAGLNAATCRIRPSRLKVRVGRVTVVTVHVTRAGAPVRRARVRATALGKHRARLATARTDRSGRARLRLHPRHAGRVRVSVVGVSRCAPVRLTAVRG